MIFSILTIGNCVNYPLYYCVYIERFTKYNIKNVDNVLQFSLLGINENFINRSVILGLSLIIILPLSMIDDLENFAIFSFIGNIFLITPLGIVIYYAFSQMLMTDNFYFNVQNYSLQNENILVSIGTFTFSYEVRPKYLILTA